MRYLVHLICKIGWNSMRYLVEHKLLGQGLTNWSLEINRAKGRAVKEMHRRLELQTELEPDGDILAKIVDAKIAPKY